MEPEDNPNMDSSWAKVICKFLGVHWKAVFTTVWPIISSIVFLLGFESHIRCMYILVLMAGYWVTECIPLHVTGLIPIFLCPMMKVVDTKKICTTYMNTTNFLLIAGLLIAIAIESCGLHLRIALRTMLLIGCSPRRLHFALSYLTMFLSMWLVNSACCAMMCPIIMAILKELEVQGILNVYEPPDPENPSDTPKASKITLGYYCAAPLSANIGGSGTLVGTPANLSYKGLFEDKYPNGDKIDFVPWMLYNIPCMFLMNTLSWLSLQVTCMGMFQPKSKEYDSCKRGKEKSDAIRAVIKGKLKELGPWSFSEFVVAISFGIIVCGWLFRSPQIFSGWGDLYGPGYIKDCAFPYLIIVIMFMIPASCSCIDFCTKDRSKRPKRISKGILTWDLFHKKFPWGMIFLIGGGFAIAQACKVSGLSAYLGSGMSCFKVLPKYVVMALCTACGSIFTELTSNVVVCNILVPVLMDMAYALDVHPALFTYPTCLACSHSFMMPTATPTNAIALAYADIPTIELMKHGFLTKLFSWLIHIILFPTFGRILFDLSVAPDWLYESATQATQAAQAVAEAIAPPSPEGY